MGNFDKNTKSRAWIATVQVANMEKLDFPEAVKDNPELLADALMDLWSSSGINRVSGVSVCVSAKGLYHAHMALYGQTTTLNNVAKILGSSHVEPQLGGKKELAGYLLKESPYDEKGEMVLFSKGIENIQDSQGKRSDLDEISELLEQGFTPQEIMSDSLRYRRYDRLIKSAYMDKRIRETPLIKEMYNEWHVGESGSGKTHYYYELCNKHTPESVYKMDDYQSGGFDNYVEYGAPPILFMDEFKGDIQYGQLLSILDQYSRTQIHCRYCNTYSLWTHCVITSIFPPDEAYKIMVGYDKREKDTIEQLMRRLNTIVYHYKQDGEYKTFSIPASEYAGYEDLKRRALGDRYVFEDKEKLPFTD